MAASADGEGARGVRLVASEPGVGALIHAGVLDETQLETVLADQRETGQTFVASLRDSGFFSEDELPAVIARWQGLEAVDLDEVRISPDVANIVPLPMAYRHRCLPLAVEGDRLVVAVADPTDVILRDDLQLVTNRDIRLVVASRTQIESALNRLSALDDEDVVVAAEQEQHLEDISVRVDDAPIVRIVNRLITDAVAQRASDVHIEPEEDRVAIRYRIDGVLHDVAEFSAEHQASIVARLKVMANANIAERRLPQEGRATVRIDEEVVDLRLTTIPTAWGEEVVVRILDRGSSLLSLEDLGYEPESRERLRAAASKAWGMVLVTGPTGSGKSTTLYATLSAIAERSRKIVTVEDPIEYRIRGFRQVQVHPRIGLTFASALRSLLRADPDVIMVGEIRDAETAAMAVQASLTGHLVLSTLHTNDAASAATRLIEMGVEPYLISSALEAVVAQRLARRLCSECAVPQELTAELAERFGIPRKAKGLRRAVGCRRCAGTGYRGRVAIAEVMPVTEPIALLVSERASTDEIRRVAAEEGMRRLLQDGVDKALKGWTTVEEVLRVTS